MWTARVVSALVALLSATLVVAGAVDHGPKLAVAFEPRGQAMVQIAQVSSTPIAADELYGAFPKPRRDALRALLEETVAALEAENPLFESLEVSENPAETLARLGRPHIPFANAVHAFRPAQNARGNLAVAPVRECPRGARCIGVFGRPRSKLDAEALFLVAPLAAATVLRARSAGEGRSLAEELDRASRGPASSIGAALAAAPSDVDAEERRAIRESAARILRLTRARGLPGEVDEALRALADASLGSAARSPLVSSRDDLVLVMPRVSAIARLVDFRAEVRAVARASGMPVSFVREGRLLGM